MKKILIIIAVLLLLPYSLKAGERDSLYEANLIAQMEAILNEVKGLSEPMIDTIRFGPYKFLRVSTPDVKVDTVYIHDTVYYRIGIGITEDTIITCPKPAPDLDSMIDAALVVDSTHGYGGPNCIWYTDPKVDIEQSLRNIIEILKRMNKKGGD